MDLGRELAQVGRQHQELLGGNIHLGEVGRRMLRRMIPGVRCSVEQGFDARSSCPQGDGVGMPPRGEGKHSRGWARKTTVPEDREGTLVIEVVDRETRLEAPTRHNAEERAVLVHSQTWVGKGKEPVVQHQKAHQR